MTSGWFYIKEGAPAGQQSGPLSWEQLAALAQSGRLTPNDVVWHQTLPGWVPAAHVSGLFPAPQWPAQTSQAAPPPGWGPGYPAPSKGGRRSRAAWIIPVTTLVVVGLVLGLTLGLRDREDRSGPFGDTTTTEGGPGPTERVTTTTTPAVVGEPGTWLVMLYANADDEVLEEDVQFDINEAERVGSTDKVTIVAQLDRYAGGFAGDGDVSSTRRYRLTEDDDIYTINSEMLADIGEADMGDGQTLYEFATWAIRSYPAEHYVLILSDHGGGWTGGWTDNDPVPSSRLTMQEIDDALGSIVRDTGIGAFELVGFDACLMGQLEVMNAIAPHALYGVASEEIEPLLGWGYEGFLRQLVLDPGMGGMQLGQAIVDSYIAQDIRITDDQARAALYGAEYTAEQVASSLIRPYTMSAIDLTAIQSLDAALNGLAEVLAGTDQGLVAEARAYAQSYDSVFSDEDPPSFIDLGHFIDLILDESGDPAVIQAAQLVRDMLAQTVVSEMHGVDKPGSTGLSIYFPNSSEYVGTFGEWMINYAGSVGRFATASLWDDYLTYHYTGEPFDPSMADLSVVTPAQAALTDFTVAARESAPAADAQIVAPGGGELTIAPITVSADTIGPDDSVTLSTRVTGSNVAYVYYYVAYYWEEDDSFLVADAGYINSGAVKESGGIYYPDWGDSDVIDIDYDWTPTLYFMSDGVEANDQFAFFDPIVYGADYAGDIYTVLGTYTFLDSGTQIDAEIDFNGEGDMLQVWGFSDPDGSGAGTWHEISPQPGDTFTITEDYLEFDEDPDGQFNSYLGGTMTFGDDPFTMVQYYAFPGEYVLGILVEDLDGNLTWEFANVTVAE